MSRFAALVLLGALAAAGCRDRTTTPAGGVPAADANGRATRDDFRKRFTGRTRDEVTAELGRPARTTEVGNYTVWVYERVTYEPATGKTDPEASLWFLGDGKVDKVRFD
jgi:hypothetical protein